MKRIISKLALVALVLTVVAPAQAGFKDTVVGYWNTARTQTIHAAHAVAAMPRSVSNWFSSNYFFATNMLNLPAIVAKLDNYDSITKEECEILCDVIRASTLPGNEQNVHVSTLKRYQQNVNREEATIATRTAITAIIPQGREQLIKIGAATAIAATCFAGVYAYKRCTAKKPITGWC